MKIYYFSGTGNSYFYAYFLGKYLGSDIININEDTKKELKDDTYIFFFPSIFGRLPLSVEEFFEKVRIENSKIYAFVSINVRKKGNILEKLDDILKEKNSHLSFGTYLFSPNNDIVSLYGRCKKDSVNIKILEKSKKELFSYIDIIKNGEDRKYTIYKNKYAHKYAKLSSEDYKGKLRSFSDGFYINSECIRCRICELTCERKNITFLEGMLTFKDNCEGCLKCINMCPYDAIEFEGITIGKKRYKNPFISIDEYGIYMKEEENEQN